MKKFAILGALLLPTVAFAQTSTSGVFANINNLINTIYPIVFAVAILFFLFQLAMFLLNTGEKKDEAKTGMIWGIVILVVMFSITGIISLFQGGLGIDATKNLETPNVPGINKI